MTSEKRRDERQSGVGTCDKAVHSFELYGRRLGIMSNGNLVEQGVGIIDTKSCALTGRAWKANDTVVDVGGVKIGGNNLVVIAGPCAVESEEQLTEIARSVKESGASVLRGGAFKPRSSPYSFQGGGMPALRLLKRIGEKVGMPVVSEITTERDIERFRNTGIDMVQVGSRNAQNFALLKQLGRSGMPVMLKRGMGNKVEDWICAAEYLLSSGNGNVILCERGIATYENSTRFTLDIGGMAAAQLMTHLPVGADPSHAAGKSELVGPHALAAVAAGAKFIMVEVHDEPREAKCDAKQQLYPSDFAKLMRKAEDVAKAIGKTSAAQTAREVGYGSDLELSGGYRGPW